MLARFSEVSRESVFVLEQRELIESQINLDSVHPSKCEEDIFLGFFFDGTNNNKYRDNPTFASSNLPVFVRAHLVIQ